MMHIFSMKSKTKKIKIKSLPEASFLYIPLVKNYGQLPEPLVRIGDNVRKFQLIGQDIRTHSSNVHSPVSGTIIDIKGGLLPNGTPAEIIVIQNDFLDSEEHQPETPYDKSDSSQLLRIISDAGIVGEGGAQFPTAIKYNLEGQKIDTFIINGTECEPYLTADYAIMAERTTELFNSIILANKILKSSNICITIEEQNKELLQVFSPLLQIPEYKSIKVKVLPNEYPQGGELQVIKSVTGRELPRNTHPRDAGVIVSNVGTVYAIYQAIARQRPIISRIITVSGEQSTYYGNYEVAIGTPVEHMIKSLGLSTEKNRFVLGGPMMGCEVSDLNTPITKGTSGLLVLKKEKIKRSNCISCGYCVEVCPMGLMPMKFEEYYRREKYFNLEKYSISSCIECAACEYICPSNVPLIQSIKEGKMKLKDLANAIQ